MLYDNYIQKLNQKITRKFDDIAAEHNFDYGDEFEIALCRILRDFLPNKYGISRGFVVSSDGVKAGDDIIIFDQERFPTLRLLPKEDFSQKEQIPIEAVYAYIEAKHTLNETSLLTAFDQIIKVKELCSKREKQNLYQSDPYIPSTMKPVSEVLHLPDYRNPVFAMIFSRFAIGREAVPLNEIDEFLLSQIPKLSMSAHSPELVVAGESNFLCSGYFKDGVGKPTLFYLPDKEEKAYQVVNAEKLAFGGAFAHLMAAIDYIRLGKMPWIELTNECREMISG